MYIVRLSPTAKSSARAQSATFVVLSATCLYTLSKIFNVWVLITVYIIYYKWGISNFYVLRICICIFKIIKYKEGSVLEQHTERF